MLGAGIKTVNTKNDANVNLMAHEPSVTFEFLGHHPCMLKTHNTQFPSQNAIWATMQYTDSHISTHIVIIIKLIKQY